MTVRDEPFELSINVARNPLKDVATLQPLVEHLLGLPAPLRPSKVRQLEGPARKLALATIEAIYAVKPRPSQLQITNDAGTYTTVVSGFVKTFMPAELAPPHVDAIVDLAILVCRTYKPISGFAHPEGDRAWLAKSKGVLDTPRWLIILGDAELAAVGRERVASTPAHRVELLEHAAIIVATADPLEIQTPAAREALATMFAHLRPDRDRDEILRELQTRTETVARERAAQQPLAIPPTTEWQALAAAPPSDVEDQAATIRAYDNEAEAYIAGFHDQIDKLTTQRAPALEKIDEHFLERDYWGQHGAAKVQEMLAHPLGAYLGWVLVRELAGRWVPMKDPVRSYVAIGDRAWFPFARVRHYLASRQATREYALSSFFEEAARAAHPQ
jgi:hypothetical protein